MYQNKSVKKVWIFWKRQRASDRSITYPLSVELFDGFFNHFPIDVPVKNVSSRWLSRTRIHVVDNVVEDLASAICRQTWLNISLVMVLPRKLDTYCNILNATYPFSLSLSLSLSLIPTHSLSCPYTLSLSPTLSPSHTYTLSVFLSLSLSLSLSHSYTNRLFFSLSPLSLSQWCCCNAVKRRLRPLYLSPSFGPPTCGVAFSILFSVFFLSFSLFFIAKQFCT